MKKFIGLVLSMVVAVVAVTFLMGVVRGIMKAQTNDTKAFAATGVTSNVTTKVTANVATNAHTEIDALEVVFAKEVRKHLLPKYVDDVKVSYDYVNAHVKKLIALEKKAPKTGILQLAYAIAVKEEYAKK